MASYYEDYLSKWYISDNKKHSTFINQIKNEELKEQVDAIIDTKKQIKEFDTRFDFDVFDADQETGDTLDTIHNEQFSIWVDTNPDKHKLYRLTPGENVEKSQAQKNSSGTSSSKGGNSDFKSKWYIEGGTEEFVTLEEYKEKHSKDRMMVRMTPKDVSPTWSWEMVKGKKIVYVWIGKLKSNS